MTIDHLYKRLKLLRKEGYGHAHVKLLPSKRAAVTLRNTHLNSGGTGGWESQTAKRFHPTLLLEG